MATLKRTQYTLIGIVAVLFIASVLITVYAGIDPKTAILDNALDSLQVSFYLIPLSAAENPLILLSKIFDACIFPVLTVIAAAWFFDFISNLNLRERFTLSKLNRIRDHVIVIPYNNFSKALLQELKSAGIKRVTIAETKKELERLYKENELAILGDVRSMETFDIAGINRARCIIACSKDDIQNALIAITAKTANPHTRIIARANKEENVDKIQRAGAHKVIIPERTAGMDIGNSLAKVILSKKAYKKT
jgi:voltage-gated potassium channel